MKYVWNFSALFFIAFILSQSNSATFAQQPKATPSIEELYELALEIRDELATKKDILIKLPEELNKIRSRKKSDHEKRLEIWGESFNTQDSSMSALYPARQLMDRFVDDYEKFRYENIGNETALHQAVLRLQPAFRMIDSEIDVIISLFTQEHGFEVFYAEYLEVDFAGFIHVSSQIPFYRAKALEHALYLGIALEEMRDVFHPRNKNNLNPEFDRFSIARIIYPSISDTDAAVALGRVFSRAAYIREIEEKENALALVKLAVEKVSEHNPIRNMEVAFELIDLALIAPSKARNHGSYVSPESAGALINLLSLEERTLEVIRQRLSAEKNLAKRDFDLAVSVDGHELDADQQWRGSKAEKILELID